jgi:hypothetical protein
VPTESSRGKSLGSNSLIRYNLKEIRRHGEAASVNLEAVKRERLRIARKLEEYLPKNRLNVDEAGLFGQ